MILKAFVLFAFFLIYFIYYTRAETELQVERLAVDIRPLLLKAGDVLALGITGTVPLFWNRTPFVHFALCAEIDSNPWIIDWIPSTTNESKIIKTGSFPLRNGIQITKLDKIKEKGRYVCGIVWRPRQEHQIKISWEELLKTIDGFNLHPTLICRSVVALFLKKYVSDTFGPWSIGKTELWSCFTYPQWYFENKLKSVGYLPYGPVLVNSMFY